MSKVNGLIEKINYPKIIHKLKHLFDFLAEFQQIKRFFYLLKRWENISRKTFLL
jgi:hypothetical protein